MSSSQSEQLSKVSFITLSSSHSLEWPLSQFCPLLTVYGHYYTLQNYMYIHYIYILFILYLNCSCSTSIPFVIYW